MKPKLVGGEENKKHMFKKWTGKWEFSENIIQCKGKETKMGKKRKEKWRDTEKSRIKTEQTWEEKCKK